MQKPESIRDNVLETALAFFEKKGYAAVPLSEIAQELKTSKAAIYYHFPTKKSIVDVLIEEAQTERKMALAAINSGSELSLRDLLRKYLEVYIHHQRVMTWLTNDMTVEIDRSTHTSGRRELRDELLRRMGKRSDRRSVVRANSVVLLLHSPVWSHFPKGDEEILLDLMCEILGSDACEST